MSTCKDFSVHKEIRFQNTLRIKVCYYVWLILVLVGIIFCVWYLTDKGYNISERVESNVNFQVFGSVYTQFDEDQFEDFVTLEQKKIYNNRVWDPALYISDTNNDELFIATNVIAQRQTIGRCPDHHSKNTTCDPTSRDHECMQNLTSGFRSSGSYTGKCVYSTRSKGHACEVQSWCPTIGWNDFPLRGNRALLEGVVNSTIILSNSVNFPEFGTFWGRHLEEFEKCRVDDIHCPLYNLTYIIREAKSDKTTEEILKYGAVLAVNVNWDCVIGSDPGCVPTYTFKDIPNPTPDKITFRYFVDLQAVDRRILYKIFGIRLRVIITGKAKERSYWKLSQAVITCYGVFTIAAFVFTTIFKYLHNTRERFDDVESLKDDPPLPSGTNLPQVLSGNPNDPVSMNQSK